MYFLYKAMHISIRILYSLILHYCYILKWCHVISLEKQHFYQFSCLLYRHLALLALWLGCAHASLYYVSVFCLYFWLDVSLCMCESRVPVFLARMRTRRAACLQEWRVHQIAAVYRLLLQMSHLVCLKGMSQNWLTLTETIWRCKVWVTAHMAGLRLPSIFPIWLHALRSS